MRQRKYRLLLLVGAIGLMMTGCGQNLPKETETVMEPVSAVKEVSEATRETELAANTETEGNKEQELIYEATLEELAGLLGMADEETVDLLGGSSENWSEGHQFYIGRNYQADLYGEQYSIHTTCNSEGKVASVSVWIVSGERQVTDEETKVWIQRITDMMGTEPSYDASSSEAGSRNCKWIADGRIITMYRMADILSINFNPAIGELKEGYKDNFAVPGEAAAEFGRNVKEVVAAKDLEGLADLTAFPVYAGFPDGGKMVETREDFIALGADKIFTVELLDSVAAADEKNLSPSMAGFVLSKESGAPNVVFGVRDGKLAIGGINY